MSRLASKNERSARFAGATKYDAHHNVLSKTYGALADLRRELADSKTRVAEREEILKLFSGCADSARVAVVRGLFRKAVADAQGFRRARMVATGDGRLRQCATGRSGDSIFAGESPVADRARA